MAILFVPGHGVTRRMGGSLDIDDAIAWAVSRGSHVKIIEEEYTWATLEPTKNNYNIPKLVTDANKCQAAGRYLVALVMFKFVPLPSYLDVAADFPAEGGGDAGAGGGWFHVSTGSGTVKNIRLYRETVYTRFKLLLQAIGAAMNTHPNFYGVMLQETAYGSPVTPADLTSGLKTKFMTNLRRIHTDIRAGMADRCFWQMINANIPDVNQIVTEMLTATKKGGLSGPDTYPNVHSNPVESENAVLNSYAKMRLHNDELPIMVHVYGENYRAPYHGQPAASNFPQPIWDPADTYAGANTFPDGIANFLIDMGVHNIIWSMWDGAISGFGGNQGISRVTAWMNSGNFNNSNGAGMLATTVPSVIAGGGGSPPPAPTLTLVADTGIANTPPITNSGAVTVGGVISPNNWQISTNGGSSWGANNTAPTAVVGTNTWIARQISTTTGTSASSAPLTFTLDTAIPTFISAQVNGANLAVVMNETLATGAFMPEITTITVEKNGSGTGDSLASRNVTGSQLNVVLTTAATGTDTYTVSYAKPASGTKRLQDLAGNYADSINDAAVTNNTTVADPTTVTTITSVTDDELGTIANGGHLRDSTPTINGTISVGLGAGEQVQVRRDAVTIGIATVVSTDWSYIDGTVVHGATYAYTARVIRGTQNGPLSASYVVTALLNPPPEPIVNDLATEDRTPSLTGSWTNISGHVLTVILSSSTYTSPTYTLGDPYLSTVGDVWTLQVPVELEIGTYSVRARVTDQAGNYSENGDLDHLVITQLVSPGSRVRLKLFA